MRPRLLAGTVTWRSVLKTAVVLKKFFGRIFVVKIDRYLMIAIFLIVFLFPTSVFGDQLKPGDIVTVKQSVGDLFKIDPVSGNATLISSGGLLHNPSHLVLDRGGDIFSAERSGTANGGPGIVRTNPANGKQSYFAEGPLLTRPGSLDFDSVGNLFVGDINTNGIVRVDRTTGAQTLIGIMDGIAIQDVAVAADGTIFALDSGRYNTNDGQVIRIDPATGKSTTVSSNGFLVDPADMFFNNDGNLIVSNRFNDFESHILEIDVQTGEQQLLFSLPNSGFIAYESPETLIYANFQNRDILRVDLATGDFDVLSPNVGNLYNLVGVAVFNPVPEPSSIGFLGLLSIVALRTRRRVDSIS